MSDFKDNTSSEHIPVLIEQIAELLTLPQDAVIVDATVGHGGHSLRFGAKLGPRGTIIGLDVDEASLARAQFILNPLKCNVTLVRENFANLPQVLKEHNIDKVDLIFADLGFCSAQLNDPNRGFSFQQNMPLDMRLDSRIKTTAKDIVDTYDQKTLADLIYEYGEERASRRIARFIVDFRKNQQIMTTSQLANLVCKALNKIPSLANRIHPATKTFQALRIAVNDELACLERLLQFAPDYLKKNGHIAVISFHSLEDRLVKYNFRQNKLQQTYEILTKKPIIPTEEEISLNPRARSSKLRIAKRL
ncbi:MAG: 16S rRNA (cytosine(1402)-N(4))-methyltransferase RsmH [Sedimentisphaerales bacterium]|nr:16S rRNA (cytosine(1402)-N(4))-methyltransferase RsmH [Sedimentisphaerales bacterium]